MNNVNNDCIDTKEIGGGSYPTPDEPKEKVFKIKCGCYCVAELWVSAKNFEEAKEYCNFTNCFDYEFISKKVEDIYSYEEVD